MSSAAAKVSFASVHKIDANILLFRSEILNSFHNENENFIIIFYWSLPRFLLRFSHCPLDLSHLNASYPFANVPFLPSSTPTSQFHFVSCDTSTFSRASVTTFAPSLLSKAMFHFFFCYLYSIPMSQIHRTHVPLCFPRVVSRLASLPHLLAPCLRFM